MISFIEESGQKCFALREWHKGDVKMLRVLNVEELERYKKSRYVNLIDIISVSQTDSKRAASSI